MRILLCKTDIRDPQYNTKVATYHYLPKTIMQIHVSQFILYRYLLVITQPPPKDLFKTRQYRFFQRMIWGYTNHHWGCSILFRPVVIYSNPSQKCMRITLTKIITGFTASLNRTTITLLQIGAIINQMDH